MIAKVSNSYGDYFDFKFFIKFALILAVLYYFHVIYWGVTLPGGIYNAFVSKNLNYINAVRDSLLFGGQIITQLFGLTTIVDNDKLVVMLNGGIKGNSIIVSFDCLGLGVSSFWVAFILAHGLKFKKTLVWCLVGVIIIWIINCLRMGLLLFALFKDWEPLNTIDHHDAFNVVAYIFLGLLIYIFYKKTYKEPIIPDKNMM